MKRRHQSRFRLGRIVLGVHWNVSRRRAQGERFLRMAGVPDVAAARALWKDPGTEVYRRCLAARANGLLGKHGPSWLAEGVEDDDSPLGRVRRHGTRDAQRRRDAEERIRVEEDATTKMNHLDAGSIAEVVYVLQDSTEPSERRIAAAHVLGGFRCWNAVHTLIDALAEGELYLSNACTHALLAIRSRRGTRRLIEIARGKYPVRARQEAIYTLWWLQDPRAEPLFLQLCAAVEKEEEYTRQMATEALGNTSTRPRTQRALAERLFDPSPSVRYSALCACPYVLPGFLREALAAKINDPDKVDDNRVIAKLATEILDDQKRLQT